MTHNFFGLEPPVQRGRFAMHLEVEIVGFEVKYAGGIDLMKNLPKISSEVVFYDQSPFLLFFYFFGRTMTNLSG